MRKLIGSSLLLLTLSPLQAVERSHWFGHFFSRNDSSAQKDTPRNQDFIEDLYIKLDTWVKHPALHAAYKTIIAGYIDGFLAPPQEPSTGFFHIRAHQKHPLLEALKNVTRVAKEEYTTTSECRELFFLMWIHAQFMGESYRQMARGELPPRMHSWHAYISYMRCLEHYITDETPSFPLPEENPKRFSFPATPPDFSLPANFSTFMTCQIFLPLLITPSSQRKKISFQPAFDSVLRYLPTLRQKNHLGAQLTHTQEAIATHGSPLYQQVYNPVTGLAQFFPDYIPLLFLGSLSPKEILYHLPTPKNPHGLWLVGLPSAPGTYADGNFATPLQFVFHDLHHFAVWLGGIHRFSLTIDQLSPEGSFERSWTSYLQTIFPKRIRERKILLQQVTQAANSWRSENTEDNDTVFRAFISFGLLHETTLPFSLDALFIPGNFARIQERMKLAFTIENLRNPHYYRPLLPTSIQNLLGNSAREPSEIEERIMKKIERSIAELCEYIQSNIIAPNVRDLSQPLQDMKYFNSDLYARSGKRQPAYPLVSLGGVKVSDPMTQKGVYGISLFVNPQGRLLHAVVHNSIHQTPSLPPIGTRELAAIAATLEQAMATPLSEE